MRGAIPPLPNTPSWRGAQFRYRDNFTFTFRSPTLLWVKNVMSLETVQSNY
jgi:hypothetical protein